MNGENETLLQQGIGEVRAGNKREGARLLAQVVKTEPQSEEAWFWLAAATDQPSEAAACLRRVLAINPNNTRASQALEMLGQSAGSPGPERGSNIGSEMSDGVATYSQARGLNTGELLGYGGGGAATLAPPPPPPSFSSAPAPFSENELMGIGATPTPPPSRASDLFGSTGTLSEAPPVPPPPFGQPSWAASNEVAAPLRPPLPNFSSDPYTGQPTPGFQSGGVRLGQLDPELAAQQAAQAAQVAATPSYYDAGAEMRAGLLDESVRSQSQTQAAAKPGRTVKAPKPTKIKLTPPAPIIPRRRTNPRSLILLFLLVLVLIGAVVFQFVIRPNLNNSTAVVADNTPAVATIDAGTAKTTTAAQTSGVPGTASAATTLASAVITAAVTTVPATTVAAITTAASTTTALTVAPTPIATNLPGVAGPGQTAATTLPAITVPPLQNGKPPADVLQYINDSKGLMDKLQAYQDLLINKVAVPYRRGDIPAQADLNKLLRTDISVVEMGQYANRLKTEYVPLGGYYLSQISNEYADDISNAAKAWDAFFDSGKLSELDNVSRFAEKAQKDRIRWVAALARPYPYK